MSISIRFSQTITSRRGVQALLLSSAMTSALLFAPGGAWAQASGQAAAASPGSDNGEAVVVTGSRLKGEAPVGQGIIAVNREDIDSSTAMTTSQLFLNLPAVNNLGIVQDSRQGNGGSANYTYSQGLNIHGVGPYATLMLIDGQRVVPQGSYGLIGSDTSIIPTIALERLEVVPDGASAIYGSDAIAGVANLVLRRRVEGIETSATYGSGDAYNQYQAGFIAGHDWGSGHATLTYSYSGNSQLKASDRSFARADLATSGGSDYRSTSCSPGNILVGGVSYAIPAGGVTPATASSLVPRTSNRCDNFTDSYLVPAITRSNIVTTFDQDVNEALSVHGTAFYSRRAVDMQIGTPTTTLAVPATNAYFVRPAGTTGAETVSHAYDDLPQIAYGKGVSEVFQGTVGASLKLPYQWKATLDFTYGGSNDVFRTIGAINNSALSAALASSNPATALNPYGPSNASVLAGISNSRNGIAGHGRQSVTDLGLTGDLFQLPAGPVSLAVGYQHQYNSQLAISASGTPAAPTQIVQVDANRFVDSAYLEAKIPLIAPDANIPGVYRLTADVAARYDDYSDVGSTSNPKFGLDWDVVQGLRLHGSYSTSFRAPGLYHAHADGTSLVTTVADPTLGGASVQVLETVGGAATKPETAKTYSLGMDFKPVSIPGLSTSLSYFNVDYEGEILALSQNAQLLNQSYYSNLGIITRNPTQAQIAALLAKYPLTSGTVPANLPILAYTQARNLGAVRTSGLDFSISYRREIQDWGDFTVGSSGTWFLQYASSVAPGAPFVDLLGTILNPTQYQIRNYAGWRKDGANVFVTANTTASYTNNLVTPSQTVASYTTIDLHLGYDLSRYARPLSKLGVALDFTNLFNAEPPFVNISPSSQTEGGYDATEASPIGRIIAVTLTAAY